MAHEREWELKFEINPGDMATDASASWLPKGICEAEPRKLESVYYDTPKSKLRKRRTALRVRKSDDRFRQTIKQHGSAEFARGEWEHDIGGPHPTPRAARGTPLEHFMSKSRRRNKLMPLFQVDVERRSCNVVKADAIVEASLDRGHVEAGEDRLSICELEFELKHGDPRELFDIAREVVDHAPLRLSFLSKGERGYRLREKSLARPTPASHVRFRRRATAKEAFQVICRSCLHDITNNVATIEWEHSVECAHKTRIAVRRLRTAMTLFKKIIVGAEDDRLRRELKWFSDLLGEARDLDVIQMESAIPQARELSGGRALVEVVADKRHAAHGRLMQAVRAKRFFVLLVDLVAWIEDGDWLKRKSRKGDGPVARFARTEIARRRKRLVKKAGHLAEIAPEARHRIRIAGKKLRYMMEFLEPLAQTKTQRREHGKFVKHLESLQTSLGTLHDAEARGDFFREIAEVPPGLTPPDGSASAAVALAETRTNDAELLRQASAAYAKLAKIGTRDIFVRA
ncbi:MAG: inorganic triphosphatase [Beijerinckiaceae bacterium]